MCHVSAVPAGRVLLMFLWMLLARISSSAPPYPYGETFSGDGTYYGDIPLGDAHCAFDYPEPHIYDGMIPLAVSKYNMYDGSAICGACIEGSASGAGSGSDPLPTTFKGFVSDSCGECADGDLDFATVGDGRWDVTWQFVECPAGGDPTFIFEGSNSFYWKVQARETATPVIQLSVDGVEATMTEDNFFEVGSGPYEGGQAVETLTMGGEAKTTFVSLGGTTSTTGGGSSGVEESTYDSTSPSQSSSTIPEEEDSASDVTKDLTSADYTEDPTSAPTELPLSVTEESLAQTSSGSAPTPDDYAAQEDDAISNDDAIPDDFMEDVTDDVVASSTGDYQGSFSNSSSATSDDTADVMDDSATLEGQSSTASVTDDGTAAVTDSLSNDDEAREGADGYSTSATTNDDVSYATNMTSGAIDSDVGDYDDDMTAIDEEYHDNSTVDIADGETTGTDDFMTSSSSTNDTVYRDDPPEMESVDTGLNTTSSVMDNDYVSTVATPQPTVSPTDHSMTTSYDSQAVGDTDGSLSASEEYATVSTDALVNGTEKYTLYPTPAATEFPTVSYAEDDVGSGDVPSDSVGFTDDDGVDDRAARTADDVNGGVRLSRRSFLGALAFVGYVIEGIF